MDTQVIHPAGYVIYMYKTIQREPSVVFDDTGEKLPIKPQCVQGRSSAMKLWMKPEEHLCIALLTFDVKPIEAPREAQQRMSTVHIIGLV